MHCPSCEGEVSPALDMSPSGRVMAQCPKCQSVLGPAPGSEPLPPGPKEAGEPVTRVVTGRVVPGGKPKESGDLVAEAKTRLGVIDAELERLQGLQRERRRLAAMIAAAEAEDAAEHPIAAE